MYQLLSGINQWTPELKNLARKPLRSLAKSELEMIVRAAGHSELIGSTRNSLIDVVELISPQELLNAYEESKEEQARTRQEEDERLLEQRNIRLSRKAAPGYIPDVTAVLGSHEITIKLELR